MNIFTGAAQDTVAQVNHVTPANVEIADVFEIELSNAVGEAYTISFTADGATVQNVVEGLKAAADAASAAGYAPWDEVTCTEDDTKLIVTADTAGVPFWVTTSTTDGGGNDTQTLSDANSVACRGPKIWDDPDNWSTGVAAAGSDDVVVSRDAGDIYGGDFSTVDLNSVRTEAGYTGEIGSAAHPLHLSADGETDQTAVLAGTGVSHLELDDFASVLVRDAAANPEGGYGLHITGVDIAALYVRPDNDGAGIGVAALAGTSAEVDLIEVAGGEVEIGVDVLNSDGANPPNTLRVTGGETTCWAQVDEIVNEGDGGQLTYRGDDAEQVDCWGGTTYWDTDADITTKLRNGNGGVIDLDAGVGAMTVAAAELTTGYHVIDTARRATWTAGRDLVGCGRADGEVDLGVNFTEDNSEI